MVTKFATKDFDKVSDEGVMLMGGREWCRGWVNKYAGDCCGKFLLSWVSRIQSRLSVTQIVSMASKLELLFYGAFLTLGPSAPGGAGSL